MIDVYYGKPPKLLSLPNCIEMSHATFRLYDCLWGLSDRYSGFQVEVTDDEIIKRTTLSKGALNLARKDLSRRGLILCNRQQRGHRYVILNPETLQPYSANPKQRIRYTKKSSSPMAPPGLHSCRRGRSHVGQRALSAGGLLWTTHKAVARLGGALARLPSCERVRRC
jgi:hypothetical protein